MESPNYSVVEIDVPPAHSADKGRGKNAKQFTWVLLLKAHRAVGCLAYLAATLCALPKTIKKRLTLQHQIPSKSDKLSKGSLLFKFIRGFLVLSLVTLTFELIGMDGTFRSRICICRRAGRFEGGHIRRTFRGFHLAPTTLRTRFRLCRIYASFSSSYSRLIGSSCALVASGLS